MFKRKIIEFELSFNNKIASYRMVSFLLCSGNVKNITIISTVPFVSEFGVNEEIHSTYHWFECDDIPEALQLYRKKCSSTQSEPIIFHRFVTVQKRERRKLCQMLWKRWMRPDGIVNWLASQNLDNETINVYLSIISSLSSSGNLLICCNQVYWW